MPPSTVPQRRYDEPWVMMRQIKNLLAGTVHPAHTVNFDWAGTYCSSYPPSDSIMVPSRSLPCVIALRCMHLRPLSPHLDHLTTGFYVDPSSSDACDRAGWSPHRDRPMFSEASFRSDGSAKYTTTWIALTDATPETSCLYCVPACDDSYYKKDDGGVAPTANTCQDNNSFANIRALPVQAGGLLTFTHRLLHWGSKVRSRARVRPDTTYYLRSTRGLPGPSLSWVE